jgi:hypothetical protein
MFNSPLLVIEAEVCCGVFDEMRRSQELVVDTSNRKSLAFRGATARIGRACNLRSACAVLQLQADAPLSLINAWNLSKWQPSASTTHSLLFALLGTLPNFLILAEIITSHV